MKKLFAGVLGSFCILRAILIFGVGWGNFDIFVLFAVGVFLWYLVLSSSYFWTGRAFTRLFFVEIL